MLTSIMRAKRRSVSSGSAPGMWLAALARLGNATRMLSLPAFPMYAPLTPGKLQGGEYTSKASLFRPFSAWERIGRTGEYMPALLFIGLGLSAVPTERRTLRLVLGMVIEVFSLMLPFIAATNSDTSGRESRAAASFSNAAMLPASVPALVLGAEVLLPKMLVTAFIVHILTARRRRCSSLCTLSTFCTGLFWMLRACLAYCRSVNRL